MFWGHSSSYLSGRKQLETFFFSRKPESPRYKHISCFLVYIGSCLRIVSWQYASFCTVLWQTEILPMSFHKECKVQSWAGFELYPVIIISIQMSFAVLLVYVIQIRDWGCLAFASQIMQLRAVCHKHPNSSSFHGCRAERLHYVFSGIWGGGESKGLKFEFKKWKLLGAVCLWGTSLHQFWSCGWWS